MIEIQLTKGWIAIVDDCDADLAGMKWYAINPRTDHVYASRNVKKGKSDKATHITMHRVIAERIIGRQLCKGEVVDHIDSDGRNNRRENLRVCNSTQNSRNRRKLKSGSSSYKGVTYRKADGKWWARITVNGKDISVGLFRTPELAHAAYCEAAKKYHGEFARFG